MNARGRPGGARDRAIGVLVGALLVLAPVLTGQRTLPWIGGAVEITDTAVGPVLVVFAASIAVAALLILRGHGWAGPGAIALGILAAAFCGTAIASLATSGTFLGLVGGTEYWDTLGPGPVISLSGALLAAGSVLLGPTIAAVLVGDALFASAVGLWSLPRIASAAFPVAWLSPWIALAVIATAWRLRGGGSVGGLVLGPLLLTALPAVAYLGFRGAAVGPPPHAWVTGDAAAGLVILGALWVGVGVLAASMARAPAG